MHPEPTVQLHVASFADLDTTTLYALLKLRVDVFVVEQECPYPELDGRDTEPGTRHLWLARESEVVGYLRILADPGAERIGRVAVAKHQRGGGLADRLITEALSVVGNRPAVLEAQAHLRGFYARHGFAVTGPEYLDDGIPHVPMRREPPQGSDSTISAIERRRPV
jgi:ElaA protein